MLKTQRATLEGRSFAESVLGIFLMMFNRCSKTIHRCVFVGKAQAMLDS